MLTDWTDIDPAVLFARLKKMSDYDNYSKRTVGDFFDDVQKHGLEATLANRKMWGEMWMTPTDLSDVNGNTYTYLMNGTRSEEHTSELQSLMRISYTVFCLQNKQ